MLIRSRRRWEIAEQGATPQSAFLNRREILIAAGLGGAAALGLEAEVHALEASSASSPIADLFPAKRNEAFKLERGITPEEINSRYNNFYEFGTEKEIYEAANTHLKPRPWAVTIDGLVEQERTLDVDTLIRAMPIEERLYRLRCVEGWSMTIPWTGFPLKSLLDFARPLSSATYVRFEAFFDPEMAPEQNQPWYPWPYVEGLTIAEAAHDLAFLVMGAYGKTLANPFGAPLRLAIPWKYGFKSIKSIRRITFTAERPTSMWQALQPSEYGFWANVNPDVPHPRWSQATERVLHSGERVPTLLFNGYAEEVASLYKDLQDEPLFM